MAALSSYTPIATATATGGSNTQAVMSSIPSTYTDLVLVINGTTNASENCIIQFNGDTTATNYSRVYLYGSGSSAASAKGNDNLTNLAGTSQNTTIVNIMDYANTTTYKTFLSRSSDAVLGVMVVGIAWHFTTAINSITMKAGPSSTFNSGTTFSLYGIANNTAGAKAVGGVITSDSSYFYHSFYATDTFTPSSALSAEILTLAGGGGGGSGGGSGSGGGGAGGYVYTSGASLASGTAYTCTVGAGGPAATVYTANPTTSNGTNSNVTGGVLSLTAAVGGGGGGNYTGTYGNGATGGSGGGGAAYRSDTGGVGSGGSPTASQGFAGGNGLQDSASGAYNGGGGGGAGGVGQAPINQVGGAGGVGINTYSSLYAGVNGGYIGGGGGGAVPTQGVAGGTGGLGGGGVGQFRGVSDATDGAVGTGGGGGGFAAVPILRVGGAGGSGVIVIRYAR